jgi:predicted phosphodiesterase
VTGRFAAIADVHGNRWALEAVLEDIERRGIRDVVNLGDLLFGPLDAEGTSELLQRRGFPTVSGNQDRELVEAGSFPWLAELPLTLELPGMLLFHGTPTDDARYLLETVHSEGVCLASDEEVGARLGNVAPPLLLCGHTHIARVVAFGGHLIVNPGSVGLQAYADSAPLPHLMETGSPHARYAVLEQSERGWRADLIQIGYDTESAALTALRNGRADWAFRIRTGRAEGSDAR